MPPIFTVLDALADELRGRFPGAAIIGIDGWTGLGKSTLGQSLCGKLKGSYYDLDMALIRDQAHYIAALKIDEIRHALRKPGGLLFVSGICLRHVFDEVGVVAPAHIYMKRMANWGWADDDELCGESLPKIRGASGEQVRAELRIYHEAYQPHVLADYEYQRAS